MIRYLIAAAFLLVCPALGYGQTASNANVVATCATPNSTYAANDNRPVTQNTSGVLCVTTTGGSGGSTTTLVPNSGTPTQTSVNCGSGSTTFLAAAAATTFILIQVPQTASQAVWFNVAGASATAASPNINLIPGSSLLWNTTGYLPTSQINCISSSGTTAVTLVYK